MSYKIIGDSCLDLTEEMKKDSRFQMIPLTLQVDDIQVIDDETFDQKRFLELAKASPNCPKTACPSPEMFKKAYECEEDDIYVITLSSHLSGTYNSAVVGRQLYEEEHGHKNIKVIDSWSASAGELNIALYIDDLCRSGMAFEEVCEKAEEFKKNMKTYFVLESMDNLRKNGRLTGLQAFFATTLNIKPVMGAVEGVIIKEDQGRGIHKALMKMCDYAKKNIVDPEKKTAVIAHCNHRERAELVKEELLRKIPFRDVIITETAGVATVYAGDGGVVLAC